MEALQATKKGQAVEALMRGALACEEEEEEEERRRVCLEDETCVSF